MDRVVPDVRIAGAGIVGLTIAWRLAKAGAQVRVSEAHQVGSASSHAAAGMLAPGGEIQRDTPLLHLSQASRSMYPEFVAELATETGLPIDFAECGALERPESDGQWNELVARARRQQELGMACDIQDGEVFFPGDAVVNPRDVLAALRCACKLRKVAIHEKEPVDDVDARGPLTVIAAGCWSAGIRIVNGVRTIETPPVAPVKGHLIGYRMPPGSLPYIIRCGPTYVLQRADGFTIAGSTLEDAGFDTRVDGGICHSIHERAARLWPGLRDQQPVECWTGLRPKAAHDDPVIGRLADSNVWLAYGHYRNGILLAPITAELITAGIIASLGRD